MFFESSRRYNCQIESHREFSSKSTATSHLFGPSGDDYVVLRSQTPINCHRDDYIEKSMTTNEFATSSPPRPAPRKSLARRNDNRPYNCSTISNDNNIVRSPIMVEKFSLVKLHASKFQKALLENQNQIELSNTKLMKNRNKSNHSTTNYTNTLTKFNKLAISHHTNIENSNKKQIDDVLTASRQHHQVASGDDELDDSSTDDTEDSTGYINKPPKPGRLDLRQFDNITTAIGKLNVSTAATATTTTSSSTATTLSSSTHTNATSSVNNIKSNMIDAATTPNNNNSNNARRLQKNPRQNHGRAVAPPKLPPNLSTKSPSTSNRLLETDNIDKVPMNDQVVQLSNEDNNAIDFSQSPIAQRLLKHSKDHKVSELNSPYESDNEQNMSQNLTRSYEIHKVRENVSKGLIRNSSIDSSELINSRGAAIRQLNEILANKQPPGRPGGPKQHPDRVGSTDQQDQQASASNKKSDKDKDSKKDKKKLRSDEKLEKRKQKEEERLRRQEEEKQRRQEKKLASKKSKSGSSNSNSIGDDGIPLFIKRCIEFIELEGLDAEGLYRVPGNRAHVDAFVQKFKDNANMSIVESDVPVNAVATALKDFLSKKWGPIIPLGQMNELTELSNIAEKEKRIEAIRQLIHMLPVPNYRLLKYVFSHFVKVSLNHSLNSMDSKNLAICWWPTLLPLHFNDMVMFEQMRPHLEESIQTMIDQYDFIFDTEDPSAS